MPKLAGVPSDQLAVARLVPVQLKAGLGCDQRLKKCLASRTPREPSLAAWVCEKLCKPSSPMPARRDAYQPFRSTVMIAKQ
jgi:hypothetical protein